MVLHVIAGRPRWSRPSAQDPRRCSWQCNPAPYCRSAYSTSTPVQYPIPLQHLVRLLVLPHTARRTHDTSCIPLPGRSVGTRLRPRTPPLDPPLPRALCPPLGVPVCVRNHNIPLYRQPCPCPSPRTCAYPLPSSSPRLLHTLPLPSSTFADSHVLLSCSSPPFSSARPSCTPLAPGPRRFAVLLLLCPTRRPRTTPPAATAPAASEPWASFPSP